MQKVWIKLAMFLAVALVFQSIRLIMPMIPGPVNMFLIGSLLNTVMVLSIWCTDSPWAAVIGILLPLGAFMQGQLPVVLMIPVVALGNAVYILLVGKFKRSKLVYASPLVKAVLLYGGTWLVVNTIGLPPPVSGMILFMMSWPQIVTGAIGLFLANKVYKYLDSIRLSGKVVDCLLMGSRSSLCLNINQPARSKPLCWQKN